MVTIDKMMVTLMTIMVVQVMILKHERRKLQQSGGLN